MHHVSSGLTDTAEERDLKQWGGVARALNGYRADRTDSAAKLTALQRSIFLEGSTVARYTVKGTEFLDVRRHNRADVARKYQAIFKEHCSKEKQKIRWWLLS